MLRQNILACALVFAIALGVVVRFFALDAMEFKGDEFKAYILAAAYLQEWTLPRVGLSSSTGLFNPPSFLMLLWPALLVSKDPIVVTKWIVLLNVAGIAGLAVFLRKIGGTTLALQTTVIVALSPWLYLFSRKIWAQDALFPFLILIGWLLVSYAHDRRPWRLWCAAATMAFVTQLHMSTWAMPVAAVLWFATLRIRPRLRDIGVCVGIFLVAYAPYIAFHFQDGFRNLLKAGTHNPGSIVDQMRWMIGINGAVGLEYMWGPVTPAAIPLWLLRAAETATWLIGIAAVGGLAVVVRRIVRTSSRLRDVSTLSMLDQYLLFLLCVAVCSLCFLLAVGAPALPFYHLVFLPLIPLLCGIGLAALPEKFSVPANGVLLIIAGIFFALILSFQLLTLHHPDQIHGDYGEPYRNTQDQWAPYIEAVRQGRLRLPEKE